MIGLDTNILLRLLVEDDEAQARAAKEWLEANASPQDPPYVSDLVIVETIWTLKSRYRFSRQEIADALLQLFLNTIFVFEGEDYFLDLLTTYTNSRADIADLLIAKNAELAGCSRTITFDRVASQAGIMELIPS